MLRDQEFDRCCVIGNSIYVAWSGIRTMLRDQEFDLGCVIGKFDLCWMIGSLVYVAWSENWSVLRDRESDLRCMIGNSIHVTRPGVRSTSNHIPTPWHLDTVTARVHALSRAPRIYYNMFEFEGVGANLRVHMTCFIAHDVPIWTGRLRSHEFQIWTYHRSVRHRCDVMYHYTTIGTFFGCRGPHGPLERM